MKMLQKLNIFCYKVIHITARNDAENGIGKDTETSKQLILLGSMIKLNEFRCSFSRINSLCKEVIMKVANSQSNE